MSDTADTLTLEAAALDAELVARAHRRACLICDRGQGAQSLARWHCPIGWALLQRAIQARRAAYSRPTLRPS